jgi:hypothetical protein
LVHGLAGQAEAMAMLTRRPRWLTWVSLQKLEIDRAAGRDRELSVRRPIRR